VVSPILILGDDVKETMCFIGDATGEKDSVAAERRPKTLPQTPVITVTGRAFSMLAILSKIKDQIGENVFSVMQPGRFIRL
jgi:hypothetical protein